MSANVSGNISALSGDLSSINSKSLNVDNVNVSKVGSIILGGKFRFNGGKDKDGDDEWLRMMNKDNNAYYGGIAANNLYAANSITANSISANSISANSLTANSLTLNGGILNLGNGWELRTIDGVLRFYKDNDQKAAIHGHQGNGNEWNDVMYAKGGFRTGGPLMTGSWNIQGSDGAGNSGDLTLTNTRGNGTYNAFMARHDAQIWKKH